MIDHRTRHKLVSIALEALGAVASMTPMSERHKYLWTLATARIRQIEAEVISDEEIEARKQPVQREPGI